MAAFQRPLIFLLFLVLQVSGQFQLATDDLCFVANARSTLANNVLYWMGGQYTFRKGDSWKSESTLYALPLNVSFTAEKLLSANAYKTITAPASVPVQQGVFFKDSMEKVLYNYGGFVANSTTTTNTMSTFNISTQEWGNVEVSGGSLNSGSNRAGFSANTDMTGEGLGFFMGGLEAAPGLLTFDSNTMSWTNQSDDSVPMEWAGTMAYTRFGTKGTLITIGGYNRYRDGADFGRIRGLHDMANIGVYDIASSTWYNVTAAGDVPRARSNFCSAVSTAPDNSSVNILIYGGYNLNLEQGFTDTHILSLPSFRWINVTPSNNPENEINGGNSVGRQNHICQMYQDRQFISIGGGLSFGSDVVNRQTCNNSWSSIRVFDATNLTWKNKFDPDVTEYTVPEAVTNVIGGQGTGGATVTAPSDGFPSGLIDVFNTMVPVVSQLESSSKSKQHSTNVGAIAGGVVGGVLGLLLIIGLLYFFRRSRRPVSGAPLLQNGAPFNDSKPIAISELETQAKNSTGKHDGVYEAPGTKAWPSEMEAQTQSHELDTLPPRSERPQQISELPA